MMPASLIPWRVHAEITNPPIWVLTESASFTTIRLRFALCRIEPCAALEYFQLAFNCANRVDIVELTLPERNLFLPAHFCSRIFFRTKKAFWHSGAFWGLASQFHVQPASAYPIILGAATLVTYHRTSWAN